MAAVVQISHAPVCESRDSLCTCIIGVVVLPICLYFFIHSTWCYVLNRYLYIHIYIYMVYKKQNLHRRSVLAITVHGVPFFYNSSIFKTKGSAGKSIYLTRSMLRKIISEISVVARTCNFDPTSIPLADNTQRNLLPLTTRAHRETQKKNMRVVGSRSKSGMFDTSGLPYAFHFGLEALCPERLRWVPKIVPRRISFCRR